MDDKVECVSLFPAMPITQTMIDDCPMIISGFDENGKPIWIQNPHLSEKAKNYVYVPPTRWQRFRTWRMMWRCRFWNAWEALRGIEPDEDKWF